MRPRSTRPSTGPTAPLPSSAGATACQSLSLLGQGPEDDHPRAAAGRIGPLRSRRLSTSISGLAIACGPLLLQLPPKLASTPTWSRRSCGTRGIPPSATLVFEPRHASWFSEEAEILADYNVARAGADPERHPAPCSRAARSSLSYRRLHGSPRVYFSSYEDGFIGGLAPQLGGRTRARMVHLRQYGLGRCRRGRLPMRLLERMTTDR